MTIYNLGSINADFVYRVPHLPDPGETLAATSFRRGLGGKGANMSVAAARAAARCVHIGAVGPTAPGRPNGCWNTAWTRATSRPQRMSRAMRSSPWTTRRKRDHP